MTLVDRRTSCIVGWAVAAERSEAVLQPMLDAAPQAAFYFSDLFAIYARLIYAPGIHTPMPDKSETYRVEGMNAELRHYLARLVRQSRCFSRCLQALQRTIKLFVFAWNRRQLYRLRFPQYPAHLIQFVCP
jgi:insertion element IS1 protein InsB